VPYQCSNWQRGGYSCNDNHQPPNCAHTNRSQINTNIQQLIWQLHHCHCRVAEWGAKLFPNWVEYEHYVEYYWILMTSINNKIFSAMLWWDRDKLDVTLEWHHHCDVQPVNFHRPTNSAAAIYSLHHYEKLWTFSYQMSPWPWLCPDEDRQAVSKHGDWLPATQHRAPSVVNLSHGYIGSSRKSKHIWRSTINDAYINKI